MLKELFTIFGVVDINNQNANKALDETTNKGKVLARRLESIGEGFTSVGRNVTKAGKVCSTVTVGVTSIITASALKAKSFIGVYESAMSVFTRKLEGGEEAAKNLYNSLLTIAKNSSFAQEYLVSAGQTLVAMGIDAKTTTRYVQIATNAIAGMGGTGEDIEALSEVFGNISMQTNIYTSDLNQLATKGIPVFDILATKYGTTKDKIKEMASDGLLPATETLETLTEALETTDEASEYFQYSIAGMAKSLKSGTLTGALDSLNSSFRTFALNLLDIDPRTESGKARINQLIAVVQTLGAILEDAGEKFNFVGKWIGNFLEKIATVTEVTDEAGNIVKIYGGYLGELKNKLDSLEPGQLETIVKTILGLATAGPVLVGAGQGLEYVGSAFSLLGQATEKVNNVKDKINMIASNVKGPLKQSFDSVILKATTLGTLFKFNLTSDVSSAFEKLREKSSTLDTMTNNIEKVFANGKMSIHNFTNSFSESFQKVFPKTSVIFDKISTSITGKTKMMLENVGKSFSMFSSIAQKAFLPAAIFGALIAGLGIIQGQFGDQIAEFSQIAIEQGPTIITNLVNGIVTKIPELISQGSQLLQTFLQVIITNLPSIIQGGIEIICSLVTGIAQELPTLIPMAVELILTLVMGLLDNIDQLIDAGINLIIGLAEGLINAIPILIEKAPVIIQKILTALIENAPKILAAGWELITKLVSGIIESFPKLISAAGEIISTIWNTLKELPGKAIEWGKDMIKGFIQGIKNMLSSVGNAVKEVANKVTSFLHFSRPDEGPLREYEQWMPDMIEGLSKTLKNSAPLLYNTTKKLAEGVAKELDFFSIPEDIKTSVSGKVIWNSNSINAEPRAYSIASMEQSRKNETYIQNNNEAKLSKLIAILEYYLPVLIKACGHDIYIDKEKLVAELLPSIDEELFI